MDLSVPSGRVDHERDVRLVACGEEGVMDTARSASLPPGQADADLLQGHGRAPGVLLRLRRAGPLPVTVAVLDGVAVGVADRMPVRVCEDGLEPRFGAVPIQSLAERGDRVVRQVEQGARTSAYTSRRSPRAVSRVVNVRSSMAGAVVMQPSSRWRRARSRTAHNAPPECRPPLAGLVVRSPPPGRE